MHFAIVTPVFNCARFIDETIASVASQSGPISVRYHVQDGGSTDGTLEKLERWKGRLAGGDFPLFCKSVDFSYASARDEGMYDAVNRGFAVCGPADVMSWINADDRLMPGACATVSEIFTQFQDISWLTGVSFCVDQHGAMCWHQPLYGYPRAAIAAGVYDGRIARNRYVQQEGTFWRPSLWEQAGGLDARFRLAGDFDLWRRFAAHADLVVVDTHLGQFRYRDGQMTNGGLSAYHAEIDRLVAINKSEQVRVVAMVNCGEINYRFVTRWYNYEPWNCYHGGPPTPPLNGLPKEGDDIVTVLRELARKHRDHIDEKFPK